MPLGQGIVQLLAAIPARIEMSGHSPTWRITGESFEAALGYARECLDDPAVTDARLRDRWWPRVTLTVTTDPELAAAAPPLGSLRAEVEDALRPPEAGSEPVRTAVAASAAAEDETPPADPEETLSALEAIFTHQEELRVARDRIPRQRGRSRSKE